MWCPKKIPEMNFLPKPASLKTDLSHGHRFFPCKSMQQCQQQIKTLNCLTLQSHNFISLSQVKTTNRCWKTGMGETKNMLMWQSGIDEWRSLSHSIPFSLTLHINLSPPTHWPFFFPNTSTLLFPTTSRTRPFPLQQINSSHSPFSLVVGSNINLFQGPAWQQESLHWAPVMWVMRSIKMLEEWVDSSVVSQGCGWQEPPEGTNSCHSPADPHKLLPLDTTVPPPDQYYRMC